MSDQKKRINGGYIVLARKILDSEVWEKPVEWITIWIYILLKVNWKDRDRLKKGQGFFNWQVEKSRLSGVSRHQWEKAVIWLRNSGTIATQKASRGMIITVLKYNTYQDQNMYKSGTESEVEAKRKRNRSGTITEEVKQVNKKTQWLAPFAKIWEEIMKGEMSYPMVAKILWPLVGKYTTEVVQKHFRNYLISTEPRFINLHKFSSTFGTWARSKTAGDEMYDENGKLRITT